MNLDFEKLLTENPMLGKAVIGAALGGVVGTPLDYYLSPENDRSLLRSAGRSAGIGAVAANAGEVKNRLMEALKAARPDDGPMFV